MQKWQTFSALLVIQKLPLIKKEIIQFLSDDWFHFYYLLIYFDTVYLFHVITEVSFKSNTFLFFQNVSWASYLFVCFLVLLLCISLIHSYRFYYFFYFSFCDVHQPPNPVPYKLWLIHSITEVTEVWYWGEGARCRITCKYDKVLLWWFWIKAAWSELISCSFLYVLLLMTCLWNPAPVNLLSSNDSYFVAPFWTTPFRSDVKMLNFLYLICSVSYPTITSDYRKTCRTHPVSK